MIRIRLLMMVGVMVMVAACGDSDHDAPLPGAVPTATATPTPRPEQQACFNAGGTVTTQLCCGGVGDFPNMCGIGTCGCAPNSSHNIQVCNCGAGKCFTGSGCASR